MTTATPTRREGDHGLRSRIRSWWSRWGQLVFGVSVILLALATLAIGLELRHYAQARARDTALVLVIARQQAIEQKATAASAKIQCERSRQYGPAFADYFEHVGVFTAKAADEYRRTIPTTCPK